MEEEWSTVIFRDIHIYPDLVEHPRELTSQFRYATRPLCNFLARNVLKGLRFNSQFRRLCVIGSIAPQREVVVNTANVATARVYFDSSEYEQLSSRRERHEFYIAMLEDGISLCSAALPLPANELFAGVVAFRAGSYRNEWTHATRSVRAAGASAELRCALTQDEFTLEVIVTRGQKVLVRQTLLQTPPDELMFQHKFKGLSVADGVLTVSARNGPPLWACEIATLR